MNDQDTNRGGAVAYLLLALAIVGIVGAVLVGAAVR